MVCVMVLVFFFQAEDGIRDLVRSRGLGDVYKRQVFGEVDPAAQIAREEVFGPVLSLFAFDGEDEAVPVSYTHLTLPTIYSV